MNSSKGKPIRHVQSTQVGKNDLTWCGRRVTTLDTVFDDIEQAIFHRQSGGASVPCQFCVAEIIKALTGGN